MKGIKTIGNQFIKEKVKSINITIPEPLEEEIIEVEESESEEVMLILELLMKFQKKVKSEICSPLMKITNN